MESLDLLPLHMFDVMFLDLLQLRMLKPFWTLAWSRSNGTRWSGLGSLTEDGQGLNDSFSAVHKDSSYLMLPLKVNSWPQKLTEAECI